MKSRDCGVMKSKDLVKLGAVLLGSLIAAGTVIYSLANIHAEVRVNAHELSLRRDYVYSIPLLADKLKRIPAIEADLSAIKLSLARIEARLDIEGPER